MDRRVALVTGAARGIGRTIATDLGRDHILAFCYHQSSPAALQREYPEALAIKADLTTRDMPAQVVSAVIGRFGRLDTLVLNAGTVTADSAPDRDGNFAVNLLANDALLTAARPHLIRGACVVAISSVNAVLPATSAVLYSASKAALNTWVRGMAKTLGPDGIRVNAVAPGAIEHPDSLREAELIRSFVDLTALGRIGHPDDVAAAVRFLVSDQSRFITGEILTVSGGYRL